MTKYVLHYYPWRDGCEGIRMMFALKNIPFEDKRYAHETFHEHRDKFPYKQLPVLEVDGKQLSQGFSILRYVARELDLDGKDKWERAKLDELMEVSNDFCHAIYNYYGTVFGYNKENREELKKKDLIPALDKYCPWFERGIQPSGFFASSPSGFDFWMAEMFRLMDKIDPDEFGKYPKILEHAKRVHAMPELQEYLKTRPPEHEWESHKACSKHD